MSKLHDQHYFVKIPKRFCGPPNLGFISIDELENISYCSMNYKDAEFVTDLISKGYMYALPIYRTKQKRRYFAIRAPFIFYDYTK